MTSTIFNIRRGKYGLSNRYHAPSGNYSKSGWSPTGPLQPGTDAEKATEKAKEDQDIENFQRTKLSGYTVQDLVGFDVISGRNIQNQDLRIPIHPIFSTNQWEVSGDRPSEWPVQSAPAMGRRGELWLMNNGKVRDAMIPVMKLASAFLSNALPFVIFPTQCTF